MVPPLRKLRICIVAHFAYGALAGGDRGHIGGVERQTSLLARWLAERGHDVSVTTWDEGQGDGVVAGGVRVLRMCRRDEGIPWVRFFVPRWTSLNSALRRADAQVYYQNCGEYVTGQVALWARRHGRRFIYSVASDPDCRPDLPLMTKWRERVLYRFGLRAADLVIAQTANQQRMLREGFGIESEVVPMPCPGPDARRFVPPLPPPEGPRSVLWLGRIDFVKRPDRFLEVVSACPDIEFDLVGPAGDNSFAQSVLERARALPNLRVHGAVARDEVQRFLRAAACLCSTSDAEGFPNTFLEAWSHGIPVVATVDPDGVIERMGLGVVGRTVADLAKAIRGLIRSPFRWREMSRRAREYFLATHDLSRVMPRIEELFMDVAFRPRGK